MTRARDGMPDEHLILLGEINGKVDLLVARGAKDDDRISALEGNSWWGKGAMLLVLTTFYPKAKDFIGPLFGL